MKSQHVRVVGAGLIGTSIALGLASRGASVELHDEDQNALDLAKDLLAPHVKVGVPDLVIVATPPKTILNVLKREFGNNPQATFIDVGSVKNNLVLEVETLTELAARFVGSHPMAGREVAGPSSAQADLFQGRAWILTPTSVTEESSIDLAKEVVEALGATAYIMSAPAHDSLLARISHLPQITSTALAGAIEQIGDNLNLSGQGLRDMTRIANSDGELWSEILLENQNEVLKAISEYQDIIADLKDALESRDESALKNLFINGNKGRAKVSGKHGSKPRNYSHLLIVIKDEPGALSQLFEQCAAINANIEDLSIEHSPGQLTGLITLAFSPDDALRVQDHLLSHDWKVHLR
ncbi:MAG TPA: prephenate dehydrogenase [Candidatus Nanopelagicaceae bacterium]|jgi:prephenate dehydrogenase|nr:prephenate dehydrogenase [Candidatus Nanopelagicaceae bacterium]